MNLADNVDLVPDDGTRMKFTNCERTAALDDLQATDRHLTYRLTDVIEPIQLTKLIRKVSLSSPLMSYVNPVEGINLFENQKTSDTQLSCKTSFSKN